MLEDAHAEKLAHIISCAVVHSVPETQQALLHFVSVMYR